MTDRHSSPRHRWLRAIASGTLAAALMAATLFAPPSSGQAEPSPWRAVAGTDPAPFTAADANTQDTLNELKATLPAGWQSRLAEVKAAAPSVPSEWTEIRDEAIDPSDYVCTSTALRDWLADRIADVDPGVLATLSELGVLDYPAFDALLFETSATPQFFGRDGEFSKVIKENMLDLRRFWDIRSHDIQLVAMHGAMLQDRDRLIRLVAFLFEVDEATAAQLADQITELLASDPDLEKGLNPLFTFNAFAFTGEGDPDPVFSSLPDKIIMGDGIMEGMRALGLRPVAPQAILAHEFGHHIQFEGDLFDSPLTGPEATRRTELMADAFSTYFLAHPRGQAMNRNRLLAATQTFFEVGDCAFTSNNHHGTPLQRQRSAAWAADVANTVRPRGLVLPSLEFAERFDAKLPELVAPDV
ncbi:MAG: hypothetical protein GEV11_28545 [Streptosporangiales bacterium]|nr:hypothetical protein [Streptosporangiales bacterium]